MPNMVLDVTDYATETYAEYMEEREYVWWRKLRNEGRRKLGIFNADVVASMDTAGVRFSCWLVARERAFRRSLPGRLRSFYLSSGLIFVYGPFYSASQFLFFSRPSLIVRFVFLPQWAAESALRAEHSTSLKTQKNSGFPNLSVPLAEVLKDAVCNLLHRLHLACIFILKPASRINTSPYRSATAYLAEKLKERAANLTSSAYVWPSYENTAPFFPLLDAPYCLCSRLVLSVEERRLVPRTWGRRSFRAWWAAAALLFKFVYTSVFLGWVWFLILPPKALWGFVSLVDPSLQSKTYTTLSSLKRWIRASLEVRFCEKQRAWNYLFRAKGWGRSTNGPRFFYSTLPKEPFMTPRWAFSPKGYTSEYFAPRWRWKFPLGLF